MTRFAFLTDTTTYTVTVPDYVDLVPIGYSTFVVAGSARSIVFLPHGPYGFDSGLGGLTLALEATARSVQVSIYERQDPPPLLIPVWHLSGGDMCSHISAEDKGQGWEGLEQVLDGLSLTEDKDGLPRLTITGALSPGNYREPVERDSVTFHQLPQKPGLAAAIKFVDARGLQTEGTNIVLDSEDPEGVCEVTNVTANGSTVTCTGPLPRIQELKALASETAESVTISTA